VNYSFKCIHIKIIKMCFLKHNKSARDKVHLIRDVQRYESHDSQSHTTNWTKMMQPITTIKPCRCSFNTN